MTRQMVQGLLMLVVGMVGGAGTAEAQAVPMPGGLPVCQGALGTCNTALSTCQDELAASQHFPATGQKTCWDSAGAVIACAGTGQDGDIKAGAPLSYTDNGDGTITDHNTGLMWEKKTATCGGDVHCWTDTYTWADALTTFIAALNAGTGFAGHTDWRLPNAKELQSIVNYQKDGPAVAAAFDDGGDGCSASCTATSFYWSSTSYATGPIFAWFVHFFDGDHAPTFKSSSLHVRAVRGGL